MDGYFKLLIVLPARTHSLMEDFSYIVMYLHDTSLHNMYCTPALVHFMLDAQPPCVFIHPQQKGDDWKRFHQHSGFPFNNFFPRATLYLLADIHIFETKHQSIPSELQNDLDTHPLPSLTLKSLICQIRQIDEI